MNNTTIQARVALNAGNMPTVHPLYTYIQQYVNDGIRLMVAQSSVRFPNFDMFPEYKDVEWTDITIADQAYLLLPNDQLIPQRVFSSDSSTAPNLNNTAWRVVIPATPQEYDQWNKDTTNIAWPSNYMVREGRLYLWPTPRTGKTTYIKIDGVQDEPDMSAPGSSPRCAARWHPAIIDFASHLICNDLGWDAEAQKFFQAGDAKVQLFGASFVGGRRANIRRAIRIKGAPRGMGW